MIIQVLTGGSINEALDSARTAYEAKGETSTILIEPGTYQEQLTIDIPGLQMKNAARTPSINLHNGGVDADENAVRITWYYGHGYQYRSMGDSINYGGSRTRKWNASVLVTAPDFYAENIIFENSFNLYVSEKEAADSLYVLPEYTAHEMPIRPKEIGSTEVQKKIYRERAAAISFTETATNAHLKNCRATGRQDVVYGDQGASVHWHGGIIGGSVDFIFGAMTLCVDNVTLVANVTNEKNDNCYIAAGRSGSPDKPSRGMLFYKCHIRYATEDELVSGPIVIDRAPNRPYLARPWRWWGETVWAYTTWDFNMLNLTGWSIGLVKKKEGYNPENPCPYSYEYKSMDGSIYRPEWVKILTKPRLPDGTKLTPKAWLSNKK